MLRGTDIIRVTEFNATAVCANMPVRSLHLRPISGFNSLDGSVRAWLQKRSPVDADTTLLDRSRAKEAGNHHTLSIHKACQRRSQSKCLHSQKAPKAYLQRNDQENNQDAAFPVNGVAMAIIWKSIETMTSQPKSEQACMPFP